LSDRKGRAQHGRADDANTARMHPEQIFLRTNRGKGHVWNMYQIKATRRRVGACPARSKASLHASRPNPVTEQASWPVSSLCTQTDLFHTSLLRPHEPSVKRRSLILPVDYTDAADASEPRRVSSRLRVGRHCLEAVYAVRVRWILEYRSTLRLHMPHQDKRTSPLQRKES
jgi:hypothetical protein